MLHYAPEHVSSSSLLETVLYRQMIDLTKYCVIWVLLGQENVHWPIVWKTVMEICVL